VIPSCWASTSNQTAIRVPAIQASPPQTPAVLVIPFPLLVRFLVSRWIIATRSVSDMLRN